MEKINKEFITLGGFNELIKMRDGWMVYNKNDKYIGKSIKEYGEWSQEELELCKRCLTPNDLVIEVGSNIGSHTLSLCKTVNKGALFAFEPQKVIFQNLCANISLNSITNCFCYNTALSDKKEDKLFFPNYDFTKEQNFGAMSFLGSKKTDYTTEADVDTLDNKFKSLNRLKLLKIDAEGMEVNILKGGIDLIKRNRPFLYFENSPDYIEKSKELIELVFSLEYRLFWHISYMYNKDNYFRNTNNLFGKHVSCNMFGVRNDLKIQIGLNEVKDSSFYPFEITT